MPQLLHDIRIAVRALRRRPLFSVGVVLTLALGIGANTAIFSVVDGVLLRPLPYRAPGQLAMIWSRWTNFDKTWVAEWEFFQYKRLSRVFEDVAAWEDAGEVALTGDQGPESVKAVAVTYNLLEELGVSPERGRGITPDEDVPNGPAVVLLGHDLWKRRYGADPSVIGRTVQIEGKPATVIGVLPKPFRLPLEFQAAGSAQIVTPIRLDPASTDGGGHSYFSVARLRPGITVDDASRELRDLTARWSGDANHPASMRFSAFSVAVIDEVTGGVRTALVVLLAAVGLLLLITCANVANLLLTRADGRAREVAIRAALGAGQGHLLRLAMLESILLAVGGGLIGLGLAWLGVRSVAAGAAASVPRAADLSIDMTVLGFNAALSILTGVLFGALPALRASAANLTASLKDGSRGGDTRHRRRSRNILVTVEMALATVLLLGAGLTLHSFRNLLRLDPGFDARNVFTMKLTLPATGYGTTDEIVRFYEQLADGVRKLPGVATAGFVRVLPLAAEIGDAGMMIEGRPVPSGEPNQSADWQVVTPGYFESIRLRAVKGRFFDATDTPNGLQVIAINETLAKQYFPNEDPIGKRIKIGSPASPWRTIVAVLRDNRHNGLTNAPKREWFVPHNQFANSWGRAWRAMTLVARTDSDPLALRQPVEQLVHRFDPSLPLTNVTSLGEVISSARKEQRFTTMVMAGFAALALILAAVGIYGVIAYSVSRRTQEIGIRLALGADRSTVRGLVIRQGMIPALLGIGIGVGVGGGLSRFMQVMLYGITPLDPFTFSVIPLVLLAVALVSAMIPAGRATRVDPMEALRYE